MAVKASLTVGSDARSCFSEREGIGSVHNVDQTVCQVVKGLPVVESRLLGMSTDWARFAARFLQAGCVPQEKHHARVIREVFNVNWLRRLRSVPVWELTRRDAAKAEHQ